MAEKKYTPEDIADMQGIIAKYEAEQAEKARKEAEEAAAPKRFKAGRWMCVEECYHGGRLWHPGEVAVWKKTGEAPVVEGIVRHFMPEE